MSYYMSKVIPASYDDAVNRTKEALKAEGFGVLTEIDVKATLEKKLDVDFQRYVILGACNPPFAYRALQAETNVGLLLPCNVVVRELDTNSSEVSTIDPVAAMAAIESPELGQVASEVRQKLVKVMDSL